MKKISRRQWELDVRNGILLRKGRLKKIKYRHRNGNTNNDLNEWIDAQIENGLNAVVNRDRVKIKLPEILNFFHNYENTALHFNAIRKLTEKRKPSLNVYRLGSVDFDCLKSISTSAALVLTAELSKWDDSVRNRLKPKIEGWDPDILVNFNELGFFDLFQNKPEDLDSFETKAEHNRKIVKYIKGRCGDDKDRQTRLLKDSITNLIGSNINKWMFLHSGLSEAIVNVSHHAYPVENGCSGIDKNWYLTASYNTPKKELKVVFYDQGIGIPKSLPASELWEKALDYLSILPMADRKKDEVLLKAAVELDRTRTEESDRGKGLQDLLEFIRQRRDGYLSIISLRGLFKLEVRNGIETVRSEHFKNPVGGTLIIWSVTV